MQYPSEAALNAVIAFQTSPETPEKKEIDRQFTSDEISAYEYAEKCGGYLKAEPGHASDCALHNGPAMMPGNCNCGINPRMTPHIYESELRHE